MASNISDFLKYAFPWKQKSGSPAVPPARVPGAAVTMPLRTHRAAPSSQIKINVVPCNSVYALNMDGNSRVQLCRELSVCINTLSRSQSWRPAQSQIYTSLTTNRTWDFFK